MWQKKSGVTLWSFIMARVTQLKAAVPPAIIHAIKR